MLLIKELQIDGFLGRAETLRIELQPDLNIITGYNGAGKTNLLKSLWYTISGNIKDLLKEVEFNSLTIATDLYVVNIEKRSKSTCTGTLSFENGTDYYFEDIYDDQNDIVSDARDELNTHLSGHGTSLFFPTFRRFEGGFTTTGNERRTNPLLFNAGRAKGDLQEALAGISRRLSDQDHTFVTSISTFDIAELLLRHFNEISEEANSLQTQMSKDVVDKIRDFQRDTREQTTQRMGAEAIETLEGIQGLIENVDIRRDRVLAPITAVQEVVAKIFKHKGIQLNRRVNFGDAVNAISSDQLSAGEKQMLSFICYNAFTTRAPIFIDEPELSLHVDWQRILFPTLLSQEKGNQFIIATHSPFIYGKFPENEIALVKDRGGDFDDDA